jgi:hypothetical protein
MWSGATESEAHLQGSERRRQKRTPTPWQLPGTARRGRKNCDWEQAKHGKGEGKNTEPKTKTRRIKAKDEQEVRRINGADGRARKAFWKHVLEEKER